MDADSAVIRINEELLLQGHPPIFLTDPQRRQAFASLQAYVSATGRPIDIAVKDLVRFQIHSLELDRIRSQS